MQLLLLSGIVFAAVLGQSSAVILVQFWGISGANSATLRYTFSGCSRDSFRLQFRCCFGCISGVDSTTSGLVSPAVLGQFSAAILVQFKVHSWCSFSYSPA